MTAPEPRVTYRAWGFTYDRPRRMGWPNLAMTDLPAGLGTRMDGSKPPGRKGTPIAPHRLNFQVRQRDGEAPYLDTISVSGTWAGTKREVTGRKVYFGTEPGLALVVYAPDWVMELAADAVARATREAA